MAEIVNEHEVKPDDVVTEVQPDPVEERARADNWRPKEEWVAAGGDPTRWKDAATFVRDGELFAKIDQYKRQAQQAERRSQELAAQVNVIKGHYVRVEQAAVKKLEADLKAQKRVALADGNADQLIEIDDQLAQIKAEQLVNQRQAQQAQVQVQQQPQINPAFVEWVAKNKWYQESPELQEQADGLGIAHAQRNPGKDPADVLKYVEQQIKKLHPERFTNPNKDRPSAVQGTSTPARVSSGGFELTDEESQVMKILVQQKVMSKDEYIKQLKDKFYSRG